MEQILKLLDYGLPVAILVLVLGIIYRLGSYVVRRLLDEKTGLVTRSVEQHIQTMEGIKQSLTEVNNKMATSEQLKETEATLLEEVRERRGA